MDSSWKKEACSPLICRLLPSVIFGPRRESVSKPQVDPFQEIELHPYAEYWHEAALTPKQVAKRTGYSVAQLAMIEQRTFAFRYYKQGRRMHAREEDYGLEVLRAFDPLFARKLSTPALLAAIDYARQCLTAPKALTFKAEIAYMQKPDGDWLWVLFRDGKPPKGAPDASLARALFKVDLSAILNGYLQRDVAEGHPVAIDILREAGLPILQHRRPGVVAADLGDLMGAGKKRPVGPRFEDRGEIARRLIADLAPRSDA
jgi:hypothetical protein